MVRACELVSGRLTECQVDLDWVALARPGQTIVIYMGGAAIGLILRALDCARIERCHTGCCSPQRLSRSAAHDHRDAGGSAGADCPGRN